MTPDEIKAEFDAFIEWPTDNHTTISASSALIFARVIAQMAVEQEREACAQLCLEEAPTLDGQLCAEAIRARGEK